MKKSRRLIRNTILALNGMMVLYVGINRLAAFDDSKRTPQRTSVAELAMLRDFTDIEVSGDFGVDIVREANYSVGFTPPGASRAEFAASMRGATLVLHGFGNARGNRVRVGMPVLTRLVAGEVPSITVSGFNDASVSLRLDTTRQLVLLNNDVRHWRIFASEIGDLQMDKASIGAGKVDLTGHATLTVID